MAQLRWKLVIGAAWLGLIGYWIFAAPPSDPPLERALWGGLLTLRWDGVDPSIVAVFLLLGVSAELYLVLLLRDGRMQPVPGWPFGLAMFGLGSFVLVPYLLLRQERPPPPAPPGRITRVLSSRPVGWILVATLLAIGGWGIACGSAAAFARAFRTSMLVHVMTLDLGLATLLLWPLVEASRRLDPPAREPAIARAVRALPLVGPALWSALVTRDPV